jgi:phytoene dehydrogenase-like protein
VLRAALSFGLRVIEQGSPAWSLRFTDEVAPAMITGVAAHAVAPPRGPAPAGAGLMLATLAHSVGWPVPRGGSQAISDALAADLLRHGGTVKLRHRVDDLADVRPADAVLIDCGPAEFLRIAGRRLPHHYARALAPFRYGSAACKVDFALAGPVPWTHPDCRQAGTLHVVGTRAEAVEAERRVADGHHAERPYVLVAQPGVVDPGRAPAGQHTLWSYAHVPHGSPVDVSTAVTAQIERFAPGFRDLILDQHVVPAAQQHQHNANAVGGDITGGAVNLWQVVMRPVPRWDPYRTPLPGVYLCSASTPPGPGVHGMAGLHAARRVLRRMRPDADIAALLAPAC